MSKQQSIKQADAIPAAEEEPQQITHILYCGYDKSKAFKDSRKYISNLTREKKEALKKEGSVVNDNILIIGDHDRGASMKEFEQALKKHKNNIAKNACYNFSAHGGVDLKLGEQLSKIPGLEVPLFFISSKPLPGKTTSTADILEKAKLKTQLGITSKKGKFILPSYNASMDEVLEIIPRVMGPKHMAFISTDACHSGSISSTKKFNGVIRAYNSFDKPGLSSDITVNDNDIFLAKTLAPESYLESFAYKAMQNPDKSIYVVFKNGQQITHHTVGDIHDYSDKPIKTKNGNIAKTDSHLIRKSRDLQQFVNEEHEKNYLPKSGSGTQNFKYKLKIPKSAKNPQEELAKRSHDYNLRFVEYHYHSLLSYSRNNTSKKDLEKYKELVVKLVPEMTPEQYLFNVKKFPALREQMNQELLKQGKNKHMHLTNAAMLRADKKEWTYFLKVGGDLNYQDINTGETALYGLIREYADETKIIGEKKCWKKYKPYFSNAFRVKNLNTENNDGYTVLDLANVYKRPKLEILSKNLEKNGAKQAPKQELYLCSYDLLNYIKNGKTKEALELINTNPEVINSQNEFSQEILSRGFSSGELEIVSTILHKEPNQFNMVNERKESVLHLAISAAQNSDKLLQSMLAQQPDEKLFNLENKDGYRAIDNAVKSGRYDLAIILAKYAKSNDITVVMDNATLTQLKNAAEENKEINEVFSEIEISTNDVKKERRLSKGKEIVDDYSSELELSSDDGLGKTNNLRKESISEMPEFDEKLLKKAQKIGSSVNNVKAERDLAKTSYQKQMQSKEELFDAAKRIGKNTKTVGKNHTTSTHKASRKQSRQGREI